MIDNLDIVIKSFNRQHAIDRIVRSWNVKYPDLSLIIVDDSTIDMDFSGLLYSNHRIIKTPKCDMGISFGRNFGALHCKKEFILFLEDDFVLTEETNLEKMLKLFQIDDKVGIVIGTTNAFNRRTPYHGGLISIQNGICYKICNDGIFNSFNSIKYKYCNLGVNFMIIKKAVLSDVSWDNNLKVAEHLDFYIQLKKSGWKALFTPDVIIEHHHYDTPDYSVYRFGMHAYYKELMWKKHNLYREVYILDGRVTDFWLKPDVSVKFDEFGKIIPLNKRLHNYLLIQSLEEDIHDANNIGLVIATGITSKYSPGTIISFKKSALQDILENSDGKMYYLVEQRCVKEVM